LDPGNGIIDTTESMVLSTMYDIDLLVYIPGSNPHALIFAGGRLLSFRCKIQIDFQAIFVYEKQVPIQLL
jgi:hypothetical protein